MTASLLAGVHAVVFDAVGTLLHPEPTPAEIYAIIGQRFGSQLARSEIKPRFAAAFALEEVADRERRLTTDEARERERWRRIVAQVLDDVRDVDGCFQELWNHFTRPESWRLAPEAPRIVSALRRRGLATAIASNFDRRLHAVLAGHPLELDVVVISSEVGWRKPSPAFFAAVCKSLDLSGEQILFVGDDRVNDYDGAQQAGLRAVLLDPAGRWVGDGSARIAHLGELLE